MPTTSVTPDKDSLKKLRVSRGLSQKQAGEQCGVGNWGRYEQGKPMSLRVLRRITEFFGIPGATIAPGLPIAEAARRTQRPQDRILEAPGTFTALGTGRTRWRGHMRPWAVTTTSVIESSG